MLFPVKLAALWTFDIVLDPACIAPRTSFDLTVRASGRMTRSHMPRHVSHVWAANHQTVNLTANTKLRHFKFCLFRKFVEKLEHLTLVDKPRPFW